MDFEGIYHFVFETYAGLGILMGGCLVVCVILAVVLELRTRKKYRDRGERAANSFWDSDDEDDTDAQDGAVDN